MIVVDELVFTGYSNGHFRFAAPTYIINRKNIVINPHELSQLVNLITSTYSSAKVSIPLNDVLTMATKYVRLNSRRNQYSRSTLLDNWPIFVDQIRAELY